MTKATPSRDASELIRRDYAILCVSDMIKHVGAKQGDDGLWSALVGIQIAISQLPASAPAAITERPPRLANSEENVERLAKAAWARLNGKEPQLATDLHCYSECARAILAAITEGQSHE